MADPLTWSALAACVVNPLSGEVFTASRGGGAWLGEERLVPSAPASLAESLFAKHVQNAKAKLQLETRLLVLQLVSRLVGLHKLTVLSL